MGIAHRQAGACSSGHVRRFGDGGDWLEGRSLLQLALDIVAAIPKYTCACRRVVDALRNDLWISNISGSQSVTALAQYVLIWERLQRLQLDQDHDDKFIWKWSINHQYSASLAYKQY
jgi:hypothetical protein